MTQALTRELKLKSKQKWNNCLGLIANKFKLLEAWVFESPQKHQEDLTKHLRVDLSETEAKWAAPEKKELLATLQESREKKLLYISSLLEKLEEEVVNATAAGS